MSDSSLELQRAAMTALLELPVEIIEGILFFFRNGPFTETDSLLQLCRTCSVLRAVAQPFLYVDVKLTDNDYIDHDYIDHDGIKESLESRANRFLRTLEVRPDLAARVRGLSLPVDSGRKVDNRINNLHNLKRLHLSFLKTTPKLQPSFSKFPKHVPLKDLCIESASYVNLANFGPLLVHPSLQRATLHSTVASYGNAFGKPLNFAQGSMNLSELVLEDCFMRERCLRHFLKACRGLKSFRFRAASTRMLNFHGYNVGEPFLITPQQAVDALETHITTLQSLSLNFEACSGRLPSLNRFRKILRLCVESQRLLRFEHLPPASETVLLTQGCWSMLYHLRSQDPGLIKQRICPNIQSVVLMVTDIHSEKAAYTRFIDGVDAQSRDGQCNEIQSTKLDFNFTITGGDLSELDEYHYGTFSKIDDIA